jgi:hypothetical protein
MAALTAGVASGDVTSGEAVELSKLVVAFAVASIRGRMSRGALTDPTAFDRANYIQILQSYPTQLIPS